MTPHAPTVNDAAPPFKNSLGVISRPAMNKITMPEISPICRTVSSNITSGFPSKIGNEPSAKGPRLFQLVIHPKQPEVLIY